MSESHETISERAAERRLLALIGLGTRRGSIREPERLTGSGAREL